jgi:hypothetical protein
VSVTADARPRDPTLPQVLFGAGAEPQATLRAPVAPELPDQLELRWQTRVPGSIVQAPLVTAAGTLLVASTAGVTELDGSGARIYTRALGSATPVTAPAVALDGSRLVVNSSAELVVLTPAGVPSARHRLPIDPRSVHPTLVVTATGTVLLGAADGVLEVTLGATSWSAFRSKRCPSSCSTSAATPRGDRLG